jgi:Ni,Fe-hydrogenase III small subunit
MATKVWVGTDSGNEGNYGTAANWSPSGVPVAADDVIIANSSQSITSGLDQSAVALTSITIDQSFTGVIGSSDSDFLQVAASNVILGQRRTNVGTLTGSKRLNLDLGSSTAAQVEIYNTASSAQDANRTPLRLKAVNASTDIKVFAGSVSISDDSDNSSTVGDIEVNGGTVNCGASVTLTNVIMNGGTLNLQSSIAGTATIKGGTLNHYDDNASASTIATLTVSDSGTVNHYASGTITTLNLNGGTVDLTRTQKSKTVTTLTADTGGTLITDSGTVTLTNDVALASSTKMTISFRS